MQASNGKIQNSKGRLTRALALVVPAAAALVIIFSVAVLPRMEILFLRKGLEYAQEKTMATMPTVDGFNPELHKHDPLEVSESFAAISEALRIDTMLNEDFQQNVASFMKLFKNCYDDQVIMPEEQTRIIEGLDDLQRYLLTTHFAEIQRHLLTEVGKHLPGMLNNLREIPGSDSLAIYNREIRLKMTGALSLRLVNLYYMHINDGTISREEAEDLYELVLKIERFQIKNEFEKAAKSIFSSHEFAEFPQKEAFRENVSIILSKLRDIDYDHAPIMPTLRSFIVLWHEQKSVPDFESYDLVPLFEFCRYAKDYAISPR